MTADKPTPVVPNLRFPKFQKTPAWCVELLGCLFRERKETGLSELPLLSVTDREGVIPQEQTNRKNTSNSNKSKYLRVVPGDIAYNTMRMWEGRSARVGIEGVVSPAYTVCRPGADTNTKFFAYYFKTDSLIRQFRKYSQGLVKDTLNLKYEAFSHIPVGFPPPDEQQMIADCLGSLDDLIAVEDRNLEALREHKQGLMQQLFPQTGQSRPRLRFPEFRNAVEWQRCALGEIAEISKGKGISKSDVVQGGRTPCVRYGELYTSYGEIIEIVKSRTNLPASDLVLCNAGDVIIPASGETKEDIATCACVVADGVALGSDLNVIRSPVDGRFFSYYLNGSRRRELSKVAQGDTVAHLYPTQLSRLEVYIPGAKAEQQRIADCLSTLDARLAAQVQKLNILTTHKHGLRQQLFPSLEAESR